MSYKRTTLSPPLTKRQVPTSAAIWTLSGFIQSEEVDQLGVPIRIVEEGCNDNQLRVDLNGFIIDFRIKSETFWIVGENWNAGPLNKGKSAKSYNSLLNKIADDTPSISLRPIAIKNTSLRHAIATCASQV